MFMTILKTSIHPGQSDAEKLAAKQGITSLTGMKCGEEQDKNTCDLMGFIKITFSSAVIDLYSLLIGLFGGYSVILAGQNKRLKTEVTSLENKVNNLSNLQAVAPQVDVFSRYFISSFYANDRDILDQYLTDSLKKEIEVKDGQLQSVVFEGVKKNGKNYQVSYVLQINQEESKRTVRLTFDVQSDKSGRYGWLVTSQPKEGLYPG